MKSKYSENIEKTIGLIEKDHSMHSEKRKAALQKVVTKAHQELDKVEKAKARK